MLFRSWSQLQEKNCGMNIYPVKEEIKNAIETFADMDNESFSSWSIQAAAFARNQPFLKEADKLYMKMFDNEKN